MARRNPYDFSNSGHTLSGGKPGGSHSRTPPDRDVSSGGGCSIAAVPVAVGIGLAMGGYPGLGDKNKGKSCSIVAVPVAVGIGLYYLLRRR